MKSLFLAFKLLLLSAAHPHAKPAPVNTYWYSAQQREALDSVLGGSQDVQSHYYVTIGGQQLEYTECEPASLGQPYGRFTDDKKLGSASGQACQTW